MNDGKSANCVHWSYASCTGTPTSIDSTMLVILSFLPLPFPLPPLIVAIAAAGDRVLDVGGRVLDLVLGAFPAPTECGLERRLALGQFLGTGDRGEQASAAALGVLSEPPGGVQHLVRDRGQRFVGDSAEQPLHRVLQHARRAVARRLVRPLVACLRRSSSPSPPCPSDGRRVRRGLGPCPAFAGRSLFVIIVFVGLRGPRLAGGPGAAAVLRRRAAGRLGGVGSSSASSSSGSS